jgi:hypothetical protein
MFLSAILKTGKEFSSETSAFIYQNVQLRFHTFGIVVTIFFKLKLNLLTFFQEITLLMNVANFTTALQSAALPSPLHLEVLLQ